MVGVVLKSFCRDSPFARVAAVGALMTPLWTSKPSESRVDWIVYNMREPLLPKPVFVGSMEDAGLVADALNKREGNAGGSKDV